MTNFHVLRHIDGMRVDYQSVRWTVLGIGIEMELLTGNAWATVIENITIRYTENLQKRLGLVKRVHSRTVREDKLLIILRTLI